MNQYFKSKLTSNIYEKTDRVMSIYNSEYSMIKNYEYILIKKGSEGFVDGMKIILSSHILSPLSPQELHVLKTELAGNKI